MNQFGVLRVICNRAPSCRGSETFAEPEEGPAKVQRPAERQNVSNYQRGFGAGLIRRGETPGATKNSGDCSAMKCDRAPLYIYYWLRRQSDGRIQLKTAQIGGPDYPAALVARTIARMAALIGSGRPGHAAMTDLRSAGKCDPFCDALSAGWSLSTLSRGIRDACRG